MDEVIQVMVTAAKAGDVGAAKLLLDRCLPALKPVQPATVFPLTGDSLTEHALQIAASASPGAAGAVKAGIPTRAGPSWTYFAHGYAEARFSTVFRSPMGCWLPPNLSHG